MKYLITGGTGTLGKELTRQLLPAAERIVIYSRDELKQHQMQQIYTEYPKNVMRYVIGDIRDASRLALAMRDIDVVIHAAALKQVPACEYNPFEAIKTNILGTHNVIRAAQDSGVHRMMVISTDKACQPINLYGSTKLCAERLAMGGNNYGGCRISICRYGNVEGSRGSVFEKWAEQVEKGESITYTDKSMTRFFISVQAAAAFVLARVLDMQGGEIFIPKLDRYKMEDRLWDFLKGRKIPIKNIGIRPGEKIHETLITAEEGLRAYEQSTHWTIYPEFHDWTKEMKTKGEKVKGGFSLTSEVK